MISRSFRYTAVAVVLLAASAVLAAPQPSINQQIERRIDALLRQMTLQDKIGQLVQYDGDKPESATLAKSGRVGSFLNVTGAEKTTELQNAALQSRLKIPVLLGYDVIHGYRTIFPVPLGSAASFDPQLVEESERVAAKEATAAGVKWTFAPMVDIARDPRWGRIVEGSGEDPYLGSVIAAARVRGFQGAKMADSQSLVACAKHFVGYGAAEGGRDYNTSEIPEDTLREIYLPPFHAAVEAGVGTLMSAFQDLNDVPASANHHTLTEILRQEWRFDGFVVSDYNSVHELVPHGVAADDEQAGLEALTAGVEMDMADGVYDKHLAQLVQSHKLTMSALDEAVRRVLRIKFRAGLFDRPIFTDEERSRRDIFTPANREVARHMAEESLVLLKNENSLLPLPKSGKKIAVIGPLADDKANQLGSWIGRGRAEDAVTPFEGITAKLGQQPVLHARGIDMLSLVRAQEVSGATGAAPAPTGATGAAAAGSETGPATIENAVQVAQQADVVVMVLGEPAGMSGEASSRAFLDLPGKQEQLLEEVVATGKPVVLVLESGRPLDIRWAAEHVSAIIQAWYPGTEAGNAIADVLFGDAAPSGRLPVSWPRSVGQIPVYYNHKSTGRPTAPDRWHTGYLDESMEPLFPFGYGLSYTKFSYSNLRVLSPQIAATGTLQVEATVQNKGRRAATEVAQLYIHDRVAPSSPRVRELKGFQRVTLPPGESKTVTFTVNARDLGAYDPNMKWVLPPGTFDVWVAPNAAAEGAAGSFQVVAK
ncbi:MAG TPA: beta-glucosidase BglX [Terriglobales bacterium]|nr:beta-glucosidase BglX [Terriglobales bacterium]